MRLTKIGVIGYRIFIYFKKTHSPKFLLCPPLLPPRAFTTKNHNQHKIPTNLSSCNMFCKTDKEHLGSLTKWTLTIFFAVILNLLKIIVISLQVPT